MIAIVDYGAGNVHNVQSILEYLGEKAIITSDVKQIELADKIILPGVSAFGFIMDNLREKNLDKAIIKEINKGKPFLGICLGFQALFENSEEDPGVKGLGIFKGSVVKFKEGKVPHAGWNKVSFIGTPETKQFGDGFAYFAHSYYPEPKDKTIIIFQSEYGEIFCSGATQNNVTGVQFHPERSGQWGIEFYKRWLGK